MPNLVELESAMPVAPLKLLALDSCKELGERVNEYLVDFRKNVHNDIKQDPAFRGYSEENYLIKAACEAANSIEPEAINEALATLTDIPGAMRTLTYHDDHSFATSLMITQNTDGVAKVITAVKYR